MRNGFSLADLVMTLALVSVSGGLVAVSGPAHGQSLEINAKARKHGQLKSEEVNMMNVVKGLAVYADSNKAWFPGLTSRGEYVKGDFKGRQYAAGAIAKDDDAKKTGAGCVVGSDQAMTQAVLLEEGLVAPAQWISPSEGDVAISAAQAKAGPPALVEACHSSYAMLAYGRASLKPEWKSNSNQQAILMASRLVFGEKQGQYASLWTPEGASQWRGAVARGDGSVEVQNAPAGDALGHLKYGAKVFQASGETASVMGIFGKHTDMANFDADAKKAQLGSAMDGAKAEKRQEKQ